jgi:SAM-dependent methyltransferase
MDRCDELGQTEALGYAKRLFAQFRDGGAADASINVKPFVPWISGKVVVDMGCKYGHYVPIFLKFGARAIICIDVIPEYIDIGRKVFATKYQNVSYLLVEGPLLPLQPESASFVWLNEVVSHINPMFLDPLFAEIGRILQPGGAVQISDGNNLLNAYCRKSLLRVYRGWEQAEPGTDTGRDTVDRCFKSRRKALISTYAPDLSESDLECLALNTSGLWGELLKKEVASYKDSKMLVRRPYRDGCSPAAPENGGAVMERGFYPEQLVMALWNLGFAAWEIRVAPSSKGTRRWVKWICYGILSAVERLVWFLRRRLSTPMIFVIGVKPHAVSETIPSGVSSVKGGWREQTNPHRSGR